MPDSDVNYGTNVTRHVLEQLSETTMQVRPNDKWAAISIVSALLDSGSSGPMVVVTFASSEHPAAMFGFRFPAHPGPEEGSNWAPEDWAGVGVANLVEVVESGSTGLPQPAGPDEITWVN